MLQQHIETFLAVVNEGSYAAAAKSLFLTPNAVKKRMETLERETGLVLFHRSNQGCSLTPAGESLARDLAPIHKQLEMAVARAAYAQNHSREILYVGLMSTFVDAFMTNVWNNVRQNLSDRHIRMVHYGSSIAEMENMFRDIGSATTLCVDIYDPELTARHKLEVRRISSFPLYVGMPYCPLPAGEKVVPLSELAGRQIALPQVGRAAVFDAAREQLRQIPGVRFSDLPEYTVRNVNDCALEQQLILLAQNQIHLYPFYNFLPLDTPLTVDFGIYYRSEDTDALQDFLQKVRMDCLVGDEQ